MDKKDNSNIDDVKVDNSDQILDENTEKQTVDYKTYERAMSTIGKRNDELKSIQDKLTTYEKAEAEAEERTLEEQGKFKERLDLEQRKREEVEGKYDGLKSRYFGTIKEVALRRSIPKLVDDADIDTIISMKAESILLDDDGFPIKESVEEIANELKSKGYMFSSSAKKNLPSDAPKDGSVLTYEKWLELPSNERKTRYK